MLWNAARATTKEEYDEVLNNMTKINTQAVSWLLEHAKPEHWAELYFPGNRYGHLTSNIAESFNSCIHVARELPILPMFEAIRHQLMNWFATRPEVESKTPGLLVRNVANSIQKLVNDRARRYRFYANIPNVSYEVQSGETLRDYRVNLEEHTCSCREWQSTGYPCSHALAIIISRKDNPQLYARSFYTLDSFKKTYSMPIIHPHSNENIGPLNPVLPPLEVGPNDHTDSESNSDDSDDDLLPPIVRRQAGRPPKQRSDAEKRRREARRGEIRRVQRCGLCREVGHSARTCTGPLT